MAISPGHSFQNLAVRFLCELVAFGRLVITLSGLQLDGLDRLRLPFRKLAFEGEAVNGQFLHVCVILIECRCKMPTT